MLFPTPSSTIRRKRPSFLPSAASQRVPVAIAAEPGDTPDEEDTVEDPDPVLDESDLEENSLSDEEADNIEWEPEEEQEGSSGNA
ncbi:hypothetical protein HF324_01365 [Chitinophaga oryzae]|uniref:Uncharacterized protein n=1 Tax=Chitinophaga oryzae TaxID=2725414 RepID=A0AAE6ZDW6_9BACT|nr:hypothetical protein [Chitinophaga oryzae]QJB30082.1 hypothetical protein HF329_01660 [Chitinophaga oryzae]QJB36579.1 hypothetical protein HF324_01365 [Chitinophaga oryzae]